MPFAFTSGRIIDEIFAGCRRRCQRNCQIRIPQWDSLYTASYSLVHCLCRNWNVQLREANISIWFAIKLATRLTTPEAPGVRLFKNAFGLLRCLHLTTVWIIQSTKHVRAKYSFLKLCAKRAHSHGIVGTISAEWNLSLVNQCRTNLKTHFFRMLRLNDPGIIWASRQLRISICE